MADRDELERMRHEAAQSALGWDEKVGPGLNEVLKKLKLSSDDVSHYHNQVGENRGNDIRHSAMDLASVRIQDMYPDWDEEKIDDYLRKATANDPAATSEQRGEQAAVEGVTVTEDATPRPRPTTTGTAAEAAAAEEPPATDGLYPVPADKEGAKQVESVYHTGEGKRNEQASRRAPEQVGGPSEADDEDTPPWKSRLQNIREAFGLSREPGEK